MPLLPLLFVALILCGEASAREVKALLIHSYHQEYSWTKGQHEGFVRTLTARLPEGDTLEVASEYLNTKRTALTEGYRGHFYDYLLYKYRGYAPDLIYLTDDNAAHLFHEYHDRLFPRAPVFFSGVNDLGFAPEPAHHAGVYEVKRALPNLRLAEKLFPGLERLLILGDASPTAEAIEAALRRELADADPALEIQWLRTTSLAEARARIAAQKRGAVLLTTIGALRDDGGELSPLPHSLAQITSAAKGRVMAMEDGYVRAGVVGGLVTHAEGQGAAAAALAAKHLAGTPMEALGVNGDTPDRWLFDQTALDRRGIELPAEVAAEAIVLNAPRPLVERHRVLFTVLLWLLGAALLLGLLGHSLSTRRKNRVMEEWSWELTRSVALLNEYRRVVDASSIVSKTDRNGVITYVNDAFVEALGYPREELIGQPHSIVGHPDTPRGVFREMWERITAGQVWRGLIVNRTRVGKAIYTDTTIAPLHGGGGDIDEFIAIRTDVTRLIEQEALIREQTTDPLTGLPNRIRLFQEIDETDDPRLAVVALNHFQEINDFYGLEIGDQVLKATARLLGGELVDGERLYRLSGHAFALLADGVAPSDFEAHTASLLQRIDDTPVVTDDQEMHLSASAGIAAGGERLYQRASMALYDAIERNLDIRVFDDTVSTAKRAEENLRWTRRLKEALAEGRIVPYFQPILSNHGDGPMKYEALVRLIDEEGNAVSPFHFLEAAKRARLYPLITRTMVEQTLTLFAERDEQVSINLSVEDIRNHETVRLLKEALKRHGIADRLVLELTESEGIEEYGEVLEFIAEMKGLGCRVAIDDFGTGYSNFVYLMRLNADFIKIDGSIIKHVCTDPNSRLVTRTLVEFARELGIETVAEFVSDEAIHNQVKALGIDYSQGYHLGAPAPLP